MDNIEEIIKRQADEIFTAKKLTPIQYVLNSLKPPHQERCRKSEYETIVEMARLDGMEWLINKVVEYVQQNDKTIQGDR